MKGIITLFLMTLTMVAFALPVQFPTRTVILEESNFIVLNSEFNQTSVAKVMSNVLKIKNSLNYSFSDLTKDNQPIYLILDTPGGSIQSGIAMIDYLNSLNIEIKTISLFAASMGFYAIQSLGERLITTSGTLMAHKARGGFQGEFDAGSSSQLDSIIKFWKRRIDRMDNQVVLRTKGIHTQKSYRKLIENEYYCEGYDCQNQGFVDAVVNVVCGKSLSGQVTENKTMKVYGFTFQLEIVKSKCPLIGIITVDVKRGRTTYDLFSSKLNPIFKAEIKKRLGLK